MKRVIYIVLIVFSISRVSNAQLYFDYSDKVGQAYNLIIDLQFDNAELLIAQIKTEEPNNLLIYHIENYIDFFKVFIGEEEADLDQFAKNMKGRLIMLKAGPKQSPYYRYTQAEIIFQYALARSKFKEYFKAGWDINKAYKLLRDNKKEFPEFKLHNKSLALVHILMGSMRGIRKGIVQLFTALEGSTSQGLIEIESLYQSIKDNPQAPYYIEIVAARALVAQHIEKELPRAATILKKEMTVDNGPLIRFLRSSVIKQLRNNEQVISILSEQKEQADRYAFYYLDYLLGCAKLNRMDTDADQYLLPFIQKFKGKHYIKEAHQKMAWYEWAVNNDAKAYHSWMQKCLEIGEAEIGEDQYAMKEAKAKKLPNKTLLKSRLLCDGGYYNKALNEINILQPNNLPETGHLEYWYRLARIHQGLSHSDIAINLFNTVISLGAHDNEYYACSAALQTGVLYFENGELDLAQQFFNKCLDMNPKEHKNSLHQKANAWLSKSTKKAN